MTNVFLGLGVFSLTICSPSLAAGPGWYNNFEQAVQVARQQGRPIFVDFSTSWCSVCKQMDRTTLADPAVLSRLEHFVKVKVDGDAFPQLCQAYGVQAYPTFVHLDPNGRVLTKREGGMRVQEMAGALDSTLRTVSSSMAIAQAQQQNEQRKKAEEEQRKKAEEDLAKRQKAEIATADRKPASEGAGRTASRNAQPEALQVSQTAGGSAAGSMYNITASNPLQGNTVYAEESASAGRRSRFGGEASSDLKELAEATAKPEDARKIDSTLKAAAAKEEEAPKAKADAPVAAAAENAGKTAPAAAAEKVAAASADAPAAPATAASPVIESRLAAVSTDSLPRPLLNRSASGATQNLAPAPVQQFSPGTAVKTTQNDVGAPTVQAPKQTIELASASPRDNLSAPKGGGAGSAKEAEKASVASKAEKKESEPKNSEGATKSDVERWMKDADTKLVEAHKTQSTQKKREARAMYNKVVEKDPDNQFGKTDMAYVKMVSLIVDRDSDLLRRQAYTKIKDFEARFPDSGHKDYYTLIRAMLATDLGETNEAHKLLGGFSDRFPDSKYQKVAQETLKSLPSSKGDSGSKSGSKSTKSAASSTSKGKSSGSSSNSKTRKSRDS